MIGAATIVLGEPLTHFVHKVLEYDSVDRIGFIGVGGPVAVLVLKVQLECSFCHF